jgi:hypothetical protein
MAPALPHPFAAVGRESPQTVMPAALVKDGLEAGRGRSSSDRPGAGVVGQRRVEGPGEAEGESLCASKTVSPTIGT